MAELKTEQAIVHTLTLTDAELHAVRQAALCAIEHHPDYEHASIWRALGKLGKVTRGGSLSDQLCNPVIVGDTKGG